MKRMMWTVFGCVCLSGSILFAELVRPPAVPLVTIDPYTSCWSMTDQLYDQPTRHWTDKVHSMTGLLRVDGVVYRFMGAPELKSAVPAGADQPYDCVYTTEQPADGWANPDFDDSGWEKGTGPFGVKNFAPPVKTPWNSDQLWLRRTVTLQESADFDKLHVVIPRNTDAPTWNKEIEIYINGVLAVRCSRVDMEMNFPLSPKAAAALKPGKNIIAAYCLSPRARRFFDFALMQEAGHTAKQEFVRVGATQTHYKFRCGPVDLLAVFTSPLLMHDLDRLSRPVSYITFSAASNDGKPHSVQIYFDAGTEWCVNTHNQQVQAEGLRQAGLRMLQAGTVEQNVLGKEGDDVRIDWGYMYVGIPDNTAAEMAIGMREELADQFARDGVVKGTHASGMQTAQPAALSVSLDFANVDASPQSRFVMIGYDDLYSIEYFGRKLRAWWRRDEQMTMIDALKTAAAEYQKLMADCRAFDLKLYKDAYEAGGDEYAQLCSLVYRQAIAAHKLVDGPDGTPLFFSKECFSNGSIGTVDVTYPSAPLFLIYNPDLVKGMMEPIFYYTESGKWTKPFAAHDVGKYPRANGQKYREDMPVEECGNMLLLTTAIACIEGNADYAQSHWKALTQWAKYLKEKGFDPENQLCTDDFAGHLAHNANLSIKAILALAGYGKLAGMLGNETLEKEYIDLARQMARDWIQAAADGDHYSLTFDKKGTWSQKYNLVWDDLLDLNIFPDEVAQKEIAYYLTKQNEYGLPLDSRSDYTKSDWILWTAVMAPSQTEFEKFIRPVYRFADQSPDRVPMSDWHFTSTGKVRGFQARSVVGGYFMKCLAEKLEK